jgi:hypothetical protein
MLLQPNQHATESTLAWTVDPVDAGSNPVALVSLFELAGVFTLVSGPLSKPIERAFEAQLPIPRGPMR